MKSTEQALATYLADRRIIEPGQPRAAWYAGTWFHTEIRGRRLPIFPMAGFRGGLAQHDLHHMLTGYDTSFAGECEVAAWELASGGCGVLLLFWVDRLTFLAIGLVAAPRRTLRAFRRGLRSRNLYDLDGQRLERLLAASLDEVERYTSATLDAVSAPRAPVGEPSSREE